MRNRYPGTCYLFGLYVEKGAGHFERRPGGWLICHADCCLKARANKSQPGQQAPIKPL